MSLHINSHLAAKLAGAYRLIHTLVLRTKWGQVFTIEIGESLFSGSHLYGAKVTLAGELNRHVGICHGASIQQVVDAAQHLVADAILEEPDACTPNAESFTPPQHRARTAAAI